VENVGMVELIERARTSLWLDAFIQFDAGGMDARKS
jgi:hypothetical protein